MAQAEISSQERAVRAINGSFSRPQSDLLQNLVPLQERALRAIFRFIPTSSPRPSRLCAANVWNPALPIKTTISYLRKDFP